MFNAAIVRIISTTLPNVALMSPPMVSPKRSARSSVIWPRTRAKGIKAKKLREKTGTGPQSAAHASAPRGTAMRRQFSLVEVIISYRAAASDAGAANGGTNSPGAAADLLDAARDSAREGRREPADTRRAARRASAWGEEGKGRCERPALSTAGRPATDARSPHAPQSTTLPPSHHLGQQGLHDRRVGRHGAPHVGGVHRPPLQAAHRSPRADQVIAQRLGGCGRGRRGHRDGACGGRRPMRAVACVGPGGGR